MSDKLLSARCKLDRADEHFRDLNTAIQAFAATNPYKVGAQYDKENGCNVYVMTKVDDVPDAIAAITGDVIHNLRCALDHLAMQVWLDGQRRGSARSVMFPITGSASDYPAACTRKINGARPSLIKSIDAIQPYPGGRGHKLWALHELDNIDKHRLLIMAASAFWEIDLAASFNYALRIQS